MNFILITAVVVFLTGVIVRSNPNIPAQNSILPDNSPTPAVTIPPTVTPQPTIIPVTPAAHTSVQATPWYHYPGSEIISDSGTEVRLKTFDPADQVTSWYETTIKNRNLKTTSFVKTRNNDRIENSLSAASGTEKITVLIIKNPADSFTDIKITR